METLIIKMLEGLIARLIGEHLGDLIALLKRLEGEVNGDASKIDAAIDELINWIKTTL